MPCDLDFSDFGIKQQPSKRGYEQSRISGPETLCKSAYNFAHGYTSGTETRVSILLMIVKIFCRGEGSNFKFPALH